MDSERFYADLPAVTEFGEIFDETRYRDFPADWVCYVTDVRNSTDAIRKGHYRAVNMVGASCITAALNACPGLPLPFVFGGDGATLLAPLSRDAKLCRELSSVAAMARAQFDLELRIGRVTIEQLAAGGHRVQVAKYRVAGDDTLAMLRGDGVAEAERKVKAPGSRNLVTAADGSAGSANLEGLSCRWEPVRSANGEMLSLLLRARAGEGTSGAYYSELYRKIRDLLDLPDADLNPIKSSGLKMTWLPGGLDVETRAHSGVEGGWARLASKVRTLAAATLGRLAFASGIRTRFLDPGRYTRSMVQRSDFRKFDGVLRMVLDAPTDKIPRLLGFLEAERERGALVYGVHRAPSALMTCIVFSAKDDSHIHFVDGNDGGYALAAVQLKEQSARAAG